MEATNYARILSFYVARHRKQILNSVFKSNMTAVMARALPTPIAFEMVTH